MNRPTETGIGVEPISKRLMERVARQYEEMLAREARIAAAEDAAVRDYEASKGKTT